MNCRLLVVKGHCVRPFAVLIFHCGTTGDYYLPRKASPFTTWEIPPVRTPAVLTGTPFYIKRTRTDTTLLCGVPAHAALWTSPTRVRYMVDLQSRSLTPRLPRRQAEPAFRHVILFALAVLRRLPQAADRRFCGFRAEC